MSQKYPEGVIIETHGLRAKIIGRAGEVCFGQIIKGIIQSDADLFYKSVEALDQEGWTVEETPWVPKEGETFWSLDYELVPVLREFHSRYSQEIVRIDTGNYYKSQKQAQAASLRVKKAYRGE